MFEREARVIELIGRVSNRLDTMSAQIEGRFSQVDRALNAIRGDITLLENRSLTAIAEVRDVVRRLDEADESRRPEA
ncbi:hypothetical protein [Methylobacterium nigriterrae]|uniref:hypothetical protein n=1 Tax=Methylobacterium nigriterrae TaxID=3127512 RepID=UPI0030140D6A